MKAVRIHGYGQHLQIEDIAEPQPGADQVLVEVKASAVNAVDWKIAAGYLAAGIPQTFPLTLGCEAAGLVKAIGDGVTGFQPGDRVFGYRSLTRNGGYAEAMLFEASELAHIPGPLTFAQAAAIPVAYFTAHDGLFAHGALEAGQRVLVLGGAGGVGSMAVQLARRAGAYVYATASARNLDRLKELGADVALDYGSAQLGSDAPAVDLVFDAVGGEAAEAAVPALKPGGRFVSPAYAQVQGVDLRLYGIQPDGSRLAALDVSGLQVTIDREYPLVQASEAVEYSRSGRARGKIVLIP